MRVWKMRLLTTWLRPVHWTGLCGVRLLAFCTGVAVLLGCGDKAKVSGRGSTAQPSAQSSATGKAKTEAAKLPPDGTRLHLNLMDHAHLAELETAGGQRLDFGGPAQAKFTTGGWKTGWGPTRVNDGVSEGLVGVTGRVYFHMDAVRDRKVRLRLRPLRNKRVLLFVNNKPLEAVEFGPGNAYVSVTARMPKSALRRGENYLLLRFDRTQSVGGFAAAAAIDFIDIIPADTPPDGGEPSKESLAPLQFFAAKTGEAKAPASWTLPVPSRLLYSTVLPAAASHLAFTVQHRAETKQRAGYQVVVQEAVSNKSTVLEQGLAARRPRTRVLSLKPFAGKAVRIAFVGEGDATPEQALVWKRLSIYAKAPQAAPPKRSKHVVLLLVDTLRADLLKPYRDSTPVATPVFDALTAKGTLFRRSQSPENWTKPSVASILTALHPVSHATKGQGDELPAEAVMISEHYKKLGFGTASFIANGYVSDRFGFDQGWDHYTNYIREGKSTEAKNVFREAAAWIGKHGVGGKPFFVYIQTIDPHVPYDPPDEDLKAYDRDPYRGPIQARNTADIQVKASQGKLKLSERDRHHLKARHYGEISYHDRELGKFVAKLKEYGVWQDTLLVFTSDHGEELGDHGAWGHGHTVYQDLLYVPLMVHQPGVVAAGRVVDDTVSTLDIAPTLLELSGQEPMPTAEGHSLAGLIRGGSLGYPPVAFSDFLDDRRVIRAGDWKLVLRGTNPTLFNLARDPGEQNELDPQDYPIAMRVCRTLIGQFLGSQDKQGWMAPQTAMLAKGNKRLKSKAAAMDDELREQLKALGYVHD